MTHTPLPPFAAWSGPRDAKVVFLAEAWGQSEAELHKPLIGESGREFWRMLGEAWPHVKPELHAAAVSDQTYGLGWVGAREKWLAAASVGLTNVLAFRPPQNKIPELCLKKKALPKDYGWPAIDSAGYLDPQFLPEVERLREELTQCRPNLIVALGAKASWALLRNTAISAIRGTVTKETLTGFGLKTIATFHPAGVMRQWGWRPIVVADLMKAQRESRSPSIIKPKRLVLVDPTETELHQWVKRLLALPPRWLAADTETRGGQITMISFAPSAGEAIVIPFHDPAAPGQSYWRTHAEEWAAWAWVQRVLESPIPKIWQNGLYDLQYVLPMGILPQACLEDTMLLHHSLFPEMNKGLGFLASVYTDSPEWKSMRKEKMDTEKRDE